MSLSRWIHPPPQSSLIRECSVDTRQPSSWSSSSPSSSWSSSGRPRLENWALRVQCSARSIVKKHYSPHQLLNLMYKHYRLMRFNNAHLQTFWSGNDLIYEPWSACMPFCFAVLPNEWQSDWSDHEPMTRWVGAPLMDGVGECRCCWDAPISSSTTHQVANPPTMQLKKASPYGPELCFVKLIVHSSITLCVPVMAFSKLCKIAW